MRQQRWHHRYLSLPSLCFFSPLPPVSLLSHHLQSSSAFIFPVCSSAPFRSSSPPLFISCQMISETSLIPRPTPSSFPPVDLSVSLYSWLSPVFFFFFFFCSLSFLCSSGGLFPLPSFLFFSCSLVFSSSYDLSIHSHSRLLPVNPTFPFSFLSHCFLSLALTSLLRPFLWLFRFSVSRSSSSEFPSYFLHYTTSTFSFSHQRWRKSRNNRVSAVCKCSFFSGPNSKCENAFLTLLSGLLCTTRSSSSHFSSNDLPHIFWACDSLPRSPPSNARTISLALIYHFLLCLSLVLSSAISLPVRLIPPLSASLSGSLTLLLHFLCFRSVPFLFTFPLFSLTFLFLVSLSSTL